MTTSTETHIAHVRKTGEVQTLVEHLTSVAALAGRLAEKINAADAGHLIGLLHDFGKFSSAFQQYLKSATGNINPDEDAYVDYRGMKGKIDHSTAGAQWIWQECRREGARGQLVGQLLSLCIASHHSGLIDCLRPDGVNGFLKRMAKADLETHLQECLNNAPAELLDATAKKVDRSLISDTAAQLRAVTLKSDQTPHPPLIQSFNLGLWTRFLFSCLIDADRIDSADYESPDDSVHRSNLPVPWGVATSRAERFFSQLDGAGEIDGARKAISANCLRRSTDKTGIYSLTAPTGGGKTYASLRFALNHAQHHSLDRIIYVVPYTTIIEQNAGAIRKVVEQHTDRRPWVLEHHSAIEPERQTWHSKLVSKNWDAPIVLTTMVQFLETLFSGGTRGARRFHQLANSVLIFDEVQTLPVNCVHLFCNALNFLATYCRTTAVLCTATQPLLNQLRSPDKGQLELPPENELVPEVGRLFAEMIRVDLRNSVKPGGWTASDIAALVLEEFSSKGSCLVIVNTKKWAQTLYHQIRPAVQDTEIVHLSTNMCPRHRKLLIWQIRRRLKHRKPIICISTQLIEAGVDIDFASVIRFLAGLDSIAQAAGRCNRHGERKDAVVHVLNPDMENIDLLRDIKIGRDEAQRVLCEGFDDMLSPEAMQRYFTYYFHERADEMTYPLSRDLLGRDDTLLSLLSCNERNVGFSPNSGMLEQSFMTAGRLFKAIDSPTQSAIVPYGKEGRRIIAGLCAVAKEFDSVGYRQLLAKAQAYSVNVFPNAWAALAAQGAIHEIQPGEGIYFLDERFYSDKFGLSETPCATLDPMVA